MLIVLMGFPGSGKTTLSRILARDLGFVFYDIDDHMPIKHREKMRKNVVLTDAERDDYISSIIQDLKEISTKNSIVSALVLFREKDRKRIQESISDTRFFKLDAPFEVLINRLRSRKDHFCNEEILRGTIEREEPVLLDHVRIDVNRPIDAIVENIKQTILFHTR